jgi:hypothetical protein
MNTDYRALCAELLQLEQEQPVEYTDWKRRYNAAIARTRAALAQPEPVAPTDEEILASVRHFYGDQTTADMGAEDDLRTARAVLARYGTPANKPVPAPPTDEEIEEWADAATEVPLEEMDPDIHGWRRCFTAQEFSETIRAAIARWGTPANALPTPRPHDLHS